MVLKVLCAAGTWMQQLGPNGASCLELAQRLVDDFIIYPKTCGEQLKALPMVAPRYLFCCVQNQRIKCKTIAFIVDLLLIL